MSTINDIAHEAGVSRATVSNVINNKDCVRDETREKVLQIIEAHKYLPNAMARNLKSNRTNMIGVIAEDITSFITPQIVDGIDAWCEEHDIFMLLQNLRVYQKYVYNLSNYSESKEALQRIADLLVTHQVNAVIYIGDQYRDVSDIIPKIPIPLLCVQCYAEGIPSLSIDNEDAAYQMTRYILEKGHRDIGVITGILQASEKRLQGVKKALKEKALALNPQWIFRGDWTYQAGIHAAQSMLMLEKYPSAVFAFCDNMAAGMIAALSEQNPVAIRKMSIAGFDDSIAEYLTPKLTTISAPFHDVGYNAAKLLEQLLCGEKSKSMEQQFLPCKIVIRDSIRECV